MSPLLSSRLTPLAQMPLVIHLPPELDNAIRKCTTYGLEQDPGMSIKVKDIVLNKIGFEANGVIRYKEGRFDIYPWATGSSNSSGVDHAGTNGVGTYHSHPGGSPIDVPDLRAMFNRDRSTENFSIVDGYGDRRTALFKTADSPKIPPNDTVNAQYKKKHPATYNWRKDAVDEIVETARRAYMAYYEGRGCILYRVYPKEKKGVATPSRSTR